MCGFLSLYLGLDFCFYFLHKLNIIDFSLDRVPHLLAINSKPLSQPAEGAAEAYSLFKRLSSLRQAYLQRHLAHYEVLRPLLAADAEARVLSEEGLSAQDEIERLV